MAGAGPTAAPRGSRRAWGGASGAWPQAPPQPRGARTVKPVARALPRAYWARGSGAGLRAAARRAEETGDGLSQVLAGSPGTGRARMNSLRDPSRRPCLPGTGRASGGLQAATVSEAASVSEAARVLTTECRPRQSGRPAPTGRAAVAVPDAEAPGPCWDSGSQKRSPGRNTYLRPPSPKIKIS